MLLKRVYDHSGGTPRLDHVKVLRAGARQNFSTRFVERGLASGLVSLDADRLTLHTVPELVYRIVRRPGYYCCHDAAPLADANAAKTYLAKRFPDATSPDPNNPAGYRRDNFYACERVD